MPLCGVICLLLTQSGHQADLIAIVFARNLSQERGRQKYRATRRYFVPECECRTVIGT